ncbi:MAG TPA: hypothetical protein PK843_18300 [bacterium]|nr:hypothetical protein [bacterium]
MINRACTFLSAMLLAVHLTVAGRTADAGIVPWTINLPPSLAQDKAVQAALADLNAIARSCGVQFSIPQTLDALPGQVVVISRIGVKKPSDLLRPHRANWMPVRHPEGFKLMTVGQAPDKALLISGGSPLGVAYGLYWLYDRMRVSKTLPDLSVDKQPSLAIRMTRSMVASKDDLHRALRFGLNTVFGENPLNLIPWDSEPESSENAGKRETAKALIEYAHALHMKYLAFGTDFTFHPSLLQEFNAALSPDDPAFWEAVQAKYRRLFYSMPELDGLANFLGEEQMYWGNYQTFDPIHHGIDCDWSLEKRYRTFLIKVREVVAEEFGKLYFHITWDNSPGEVHAQPQVYRRILDETVPVENLYLIPSSTQNDRWWFQAFNPTFNQTPHRMLVIFETMDYHHGENMFPTFPGPYYQAWLQLVLGSTPSNLQGANADMPAQDVWNETRNLTAYTLYRLMWNPHEDVQTIAEDFAAIHFGPAAAAGMADLFMLSPIAYKYGLYIEPVTYGQFTSLPHIRVGSFVVQGFPAIDKGKEHIEFLRKLYVRCKPWIPETLSYLDHGLETAETMRRKFELIAPALADEARSNQVAQALDMTRLLIQTNNRYVKSFFAYFHYLENPDESSRQQLAEQVQALQIACEQFQHVPGFGYDLAGVRQLVVNAHALLQDKAAAEKELLEAPTMAEIETAVAREQEKYARILHDHALEAVRVLHWEGRVDGVDVLKMNDRNLEIEHVKWDAIYFKDQTIFAALPQRPVTVIPKNLDSRPMHPFVLEQPSAANGYTAKILLNDLPGGAGWCKFDLYYIDKNPLELNMLPPWAER